MSDGKYKMKASFSKKLWSQSISVEKDYKQIIPHHLFLEISHSTAELALGEIMQVWSVRKCKTYKKIVKVTSRYTLNRQ